MKTTKKTNDFLNERKTSIRNYNKFYLLLACFNFILFTLNSQNIKKYSGEFEEGKAVYEYYEDDNMNRIFHGSFYYKPFWEEMEIKGTYKNNQKSGLWSIKRKLSQVSGNYIDGKKEGQWKHSFNSSIKKQNSFYNFKNNILVGSLNLDWDDGQVKGEFDNEGCFIGKWNISSSRTYYGDSFAEVYEFFAEFKNNFFRLCFRIM
jgi:hypothetical protein